MGVSSVLRNSVSLSWVIIAYWFACSASASSSLAATQSPDNDKPAIALIAESPLQVHSSRSDVYWLDNKTLVFSGADTAKDRDANNQPPVRFPDQKARIYIWNISGQPQTYAPAKWPTPNSRPYQNYLCASEGNIYYSTSPPVKTTKPIGMTAKVMAGPIGGEQLIDWPFGRTDGAWSFRHHTVVGKRCDQFFAPWASGNFWAISYDRNTLLDFGPRKPPSRWNFQPVGRSSEKLSVVDTHNRQRKIVSGVDAHWADPGCVFAPPWGVAFIVWSCPAGDNFEKVTSVPVWKVFRDGRSERLDLQIGNFNGPDLIPSRDRYFMVVWGLKGPDSFSDDVAGIYTVSSGVPKMALKGYFRAQAISPDGCLGAFSKDTRQEFGDSREHLIILELCGRKGERQ